MSQRAGRRIGVVVGLAMTLGLVALHVEFYRHAGPLWRDELNSLFVARQPTFAEVFTFSRYDSFPVAWVLLLSGWLRAGLGEPVAALRSLGLTIGLGTIAMLWWSGRRLGLGAPVLTLLLFGMSPTLIVYGDSIRGYGLGTLGIVWCAGAIWWFLGRPSVRTYAVAQMAAILAVQAYYGNCFLLLALCLAAAVVCLRRRDPKLLTATLALGGVAAVSLLVNLPSLRYAAGLSQVEQGDWQITWWAEVFVHALAPDISWLRVLWGVAGAVALAGLLQEMRSHETLSRERATYLLGVALLSVVAYAGYVSFIRVRTQFWYYLPLMAVLALVCDVGVQAVAQRLRRGAAAVAVAAGLAAVVAGWSVAALMPIRMTNVDLIAKQLTRIARADDLIVVVPYFCGVSFGHYYDGATPWITMPEFPQHVFHLHADVAEKMQLGSAAVAPELEQIERTLRRGGQVWIVGSPRVPTEGEAIGRLPPAPHGPEGWRSAPYFADWEKQLGALLAHQAGQVWEIEVVDPWPVNQWERLRLLQAQGWR